MIRFSDRFSAEVTAIADGELTLRFDATGADFDAPAAGTSITQTGGIIRARDLSASAGDRTSPSSPTAGSTTWMTSTSET